MLDVADPGFSSFGESKSIHTHTSETCLYFASLTKGRTSTTEGQSGRWEPDGEQPETVQTERKVIY